MMNLPGTGTGGAPASGSSGSPPLGSAATALAAAAGDAPPEDVVSSAIIGACSSASQGRGTKRIRTTEGGRELRQRFDPAARREVLELQTAFIDDMKTFCIVERFDGDTGKPVLPEHARLPPAADGMLEIQRVSAYKPPRGGLRDPAPHTTFPVQYQSGHVLYTVELINEPRALWNGDTGINFSEPFTVLACTLKAKSGRGGARVNRLAEERWAYNPEYWASRGGVPETPDRASEDHGLNAEHMATSTSDLRRFTQFPADASQPYLFFIETNKRDPNFRHHENRQLSEGEFEQEWSRRMRENPGLTKVQMSRSDPHVVPRGESDRNPASAMGCKAHEVMGAQGEGGTQGVALASHEWCHLIGDGDGGASSPENLVVGTNAVNTEQLAMEAAFRPFRTKLLTQDKSVVLAVRVLTEDVPADTLSTFPDRHPARNNVADWICYEIGIQDGNGTVTPVHKQIMDGKRGSITAAEFDYLNNEVSRKMKAATHIEEALDDTGALADAEGVG